MKLWRGNCFVTLPSCKYILSSISITLHCTRCWFGRYINKINIFQCELGAITFSSWLKSHSCDKKRSWDFIQKDIWKGPSDWLMYLLPGAIVKVKKNTKLRWKKMENTSKCTWIALACSNFQWKRPQSLDCDFCWPH